MQSAFSSFSNPAKMSTKGNATVFDVVRQFVAAHIGNKELITLSTPNIKVPTMPFI
jgi:hypothetical protein